MHGRWGRRAVAAHGSGEGFEAALPAVPMINRPSMPGVTLAARQPHSSDDTRGDSPAVEVVCVCVLVTCFEATEARPPWSVCGRDSAWGMQGLVVV